MACWKPWTIEISDFPMKKKHFLSGILQPAMFDETKAYCLLKPATGDSVHCQDSKWINKTQRLPSSVEASFSEPVVLECMWEFNGSNSNIWTLQNWFTTKKKMYHHHVSTAKVAKVVVLEYLKFLKTSTLSRDKHVWISYAMKMFVCFLGHQHPHRWPIKVYPRWT